MPQYSYQVWGLSVRSELRLEELHPAAGDELADVDVRLGSLPFSDPGQVGYSIETYGTLLVVPGVGRYLIRDGREIVVDPEPSACSSGLKLYLLGSAFGALLHQRGHMPLHANALVIDGRAVAFSGHSGAGKSTIAAWFHDRGHQLLADDVCVIAAGADEGFQVLPGIPRIRLWREALKISGRSPDDHPSSYAGVDKFDVHVDNRATAPLPLQAIYMLERAPEESGGPRIERLRGVEAVAALVGNTYRGAYLETIGGAGPHLQACIQIARSVAVFRAQRVWGFDSFDAQAALLAAHACRREGLFGTQDPPATKLNFR